MAGFQASLYGRFWVSTEADEEFAFVLAANSGIAIERVRNRLLRERQSRLCVREIWRELELPEGLACLASNDPLEA